MIVKNRKRLYRQLVHLRGHTVRARKNISKLIFEGEDLVRYKHILHLIDEFLGHTQHEIKVLATEPLDGEGEE